MKPLKIASTAALLGFAGVALAATGLTVGVSAPASVQTGTARTLATITLTGGASDVTLTSLPLSLGYATDASVPVSAAPFSNCRINNAGGTALNTGSNALTSALGSTDVGVTFDQALSVPANSTVNLMLACDVPASVPNNSAFAVAIFPSSVTAHMAGGVAVAVAGNNVGTTGAVLGVTIISSDTPGTVDTGTGTGGTPGTPNTGAGGNAGLTWFTIIVSGLVALAAGAYTLRTRKA